MSAPIRWTPRPLPTRVALLQAAAQLFAQRGYEGTRVESIAAHAAANKALVSYYFGGKAGLHRQVLEEALGPLLQSCESIAIDRTRTAADRLARMLDAVAAGGGRTAAPLLLLLRGLLREQSRSPAAAEVQSPPRQPGRLRELFAQVARQGVADGSLVQLPAALAADLLLGTLALHLGSASGRRGAGQPGALARQLVELLRAPGSTPRSRARRSPRLAPSSPRRSPHRFPGRQS